MKSFSFKSFVKILFLSHFNFFRNVFTESFLLTPLRGNFFWALSSLRPCKIFVLVNSVIYFLMYVCLPKSSTPLLLTIAISNLKRILKRKKTLSKNSKRQKCHSVLLNHILLIRWTHLAFSTLSCSFWQK